MNKIIAKKSISADLVKFEIRTDRNPQTLGRKLYKSGNCRPVFHQCTHGRVAQKPHYAETQPEKYCRHGEVCDQKQHHRNLKKCLKCPIF